MTRFCGMIEQVKNGIISNRDNCFLLCFQKRKILKVLKVDDIIFSKVKRN